MQRSLVLAAVLAIGAGEARADIASPERSACTNKEPGDLCWGPAWGSCVSASDRPPEHPLVYCSAGVPDGPFTGRIALGLAVGLAMAAGGAWLAMRKRDASTGPIDRREPGSDRVPGSDRARRDAR